MGGGDLPDLGLEVVPSASLALAGLQGVVAVAGGNACIVCGWRCRLSDHVIARSHRHEGARLRAREHDRVARVRAGDGRAADGHFEIRGDTPTGVDSPVVDVLEHRQARGSGLEEGRALHQPATSCDDEGVAGRGQGDVPENCRERQRVLNEGAIETRGVINHSLDGGGQAGECLHVYNELNARAIGAVERDRRFAEGGGTLRPRYQPGEHERGGTEQRDDGPSHVDFLPLCSAHARVPDASRRASASLDSVQPQCQTTVRALSVGTTVWPASSRGDASQGVLNPAVTSWPTLFLLTYMRPTERQNDHT